MWTERELMGPVTTLHMAAGPAEGPPLLFLHGVGRRWQDYVPFATEFAPRAEILALDLRGHGRSGWAAGRYRVIDYVQDVLRVLESVGSPAAIYGHSLGALIAGAAAAARPDAVRELVLEDPVGEAFLDRLDATPYLALFTAMRRLAASKQSVERIAGRLAEVQVPAFDGRGLVRLSDVRDAESIRFSAECLVDLDPDVFAPILARRWYDGFEPQAIWRGVRCPALLLRADESCGGMLTGPDADAIAGRAANCTTVAFPGVGHLIHRAAAHQIVPLVRGFLDSLDHR